MNTRIFIFLAVVVVAMIISFNSSCSVTHIKVKDSENVEVKSKQIQKDDLKIEEPKLDSIL